MMIFLAILFMIAAILLGGSWYAYRKAFYSPMEGRGVVKPIKGGNYEPYRPEMRRIYHQLKERPFEAVSVVSHDGLTLTGKYYHVKDNAPLDLCFHGYKSNSYTDFSGGSELSFRLEHNVLLVDQRAHGNSDGKTITFGILERQDLLRWVDYSIERFGANVKILLYGVSMGGATVLMASELPLSENVKGIVADCPYSSPLDIILDVGKKTGIPRWLIRPFSIMGARIFGGFDLTECDAKTAVMHTRVPILIIHGEIDGFVPPEMSNIAQSNPQMITRYTFPNADHGISYLVDTERYHKIVTDFLSNVL